MAKQKVKNTEVQEPATPTTLVEGIVANCVKLNVRKKPDAKAAVVAILDRDEKVTVDTANSTDGWFKVAFGSVKEAYCMKDYIKID